MKIDLNERLECMNVPSEHCYVLEGQKTWTGNEKA